MYQNHQEQIMLHINDAQAWLTRAGSAYREARRSRGELDLVLAQAELKYAWELSRGKRAQEPARPRVKTFRTRWWLPAAACLLVGMLAGAILWGRLFNLGQDYVASQEVNGQEPASTGAVPSIPVEPASGPADEDAAAAVIPGTKKPVRTSDYREEPTPVERTPADDSLQAAGTKMTIPDLDELERVAREILASGTISSPGQP